MSYEPGLEENGFLKKLQVNPHNLEFLADGCTKVRFYILSHCIQWYTFILEVENHDKIYPANFVLF